MLFGVHILAKLLTKVADFAMLGLLNQVAGAIFGLVKVAIILGALLSFLERANQPLDLIAPDFFEKSVLYEPIKEAGDWYFQEFSSLNRFSTTCHFSSFFLHKVVVFSCFIGDILTLQKVHFIRSRTDFAFNRNSVGHICHGVDVLSNIRIPK